MRAHYTRSSSANRSASASIWIALPTSPRGGRSFSRDPEYPRLTASGLVDAWHAAGNGNEEVDRFPGEGRIDHVFVTPDLAPRVTRAWIDRGTPASDHWPVFVEFA